MNPVDFGVRFCGNCGVQLNWPAQQQPQKQQAYGNGQAKAEHQKTSSGLIVYIALIVAVLLVGGWVFVSNAALQKAPPSSSTPIAPPASKPQAPPQQETPTLSNGYVTPASGDTSKTFDYYITYTDTNNDAPGNYKHVYIDGGTYMMTQTSGDYSSGAVFKYSTTLSAGNHDYYFYFNDGYGHLVRSPASGTYPGPNVSSASSALPVAEYSHLLIIYRNIDVVYLKDGVPQRFKGSISDGLKTAIVNAFKNLPDLIRDGSAGVASSTYEVVEIPRPITKITSLGGNYYWLSYQDIQSDLELYAPKGKYDSVHVIWNSGPIDAYFGMGGVFINDMTTTFSSVIAGQEWWWEKDGKASGEVFLHEWLHAVCRFYANLGYPMPEGDADGADEHGYMESQTEGWMGYYRDLMRGQVWEPKQSTYTGITKEAWGR
jgi:hypothetical protein